METKIIGDITVFSHNKQPCLYCDYKYEHPCDHNVIVTCPKCGYQQRANDHSPATKL